MNNLLLQNNFTLYTTPCKEMSKVYQQNDLFISAFPCMEEIRRQGKLCDVVLKVHNSFVSFFE